MVRTLSLSTVHITSLSPNTCFFSLLAMTEMAPWLAQDSFLSSQLDDSNSKLYNELKAKNEVELKKLQDKIEDAETNLGETELSDALRAKASYLAKIGEKVRFTKQLSFPVRRHSALEHTKPWGTTFFLVSFGIRMLQWMSCSRRTDRPPGTVTRQKRQRLTIAFSFNLSLDICIYIGQSS